MPCLESELHSLAEFIGKILCGIEFKDDNSSNHYTSICRQLTGRLEEASRTTEGKVSIFEVN